MLIENLKETISLLNNNGYNLNLLLSGDTDFKKKITEEHINENLNENLNEITKKNFRELLKSEKNTINIILTNIPENGKGPSYFGMFPTKDSLEKIFQNYSEFITQKTPLHVTCKFHGGKLYNNDEKGLFQLYKVKVLGLTRNKAGYALKVQCDLGGDHITLSTNEGFKPVDVGKSEELEFISNEFEIECLYLPYF